MKNVIIRTDASIEIGSGHIMRCLTIAHNLKKRGCTVKFLMLPLQGNLIDYVQQQGFENINIEEMADLYIVDHYELDKEQESAFRYFAKKVAVIDDLANRLHDCDLLLDQNLVPNFERRYDGLVPQNCVKLLGPEYLIMRDEFVEARQHLCNPQNNINRLLIFMGGTDPTNETMKILQALDGFYFEHVDIVVGNGNVYKEEIARICQERGYYYHCQINYMAHLMQQADFAIGAGGSTMWERCYVGLPSASTIVAYNQHMTTYYAAQLGAVINLGWHEDITASSYRALFEQLNTVNLAEMSSIGLNVTAKNEPNAWISKLMELIT